MESILAEQNWMINLISFQETIFTMKPRVAISRHLGLIWNYLEISSKTSTGIEKELDKEAFILTMTQLIDEYGQEHFYYIELNNKVMNVPENYHIVTLKSMIDSYKCQIVGGNPEYFGRLD